MKIMSTPKIFLNLMSTPKIFMSTPKIFLNYIHFVVSLFFSKFEKCNKGIMSHLRI